MLDAVVDLAHERPHVVRRGLHRLQRELECRQAQWLRARPRLAADGQRVNLMPRSRQRRREVSELSGEILVNEEDLQMDSQAKAEASGTRSTLSSPIVKARCSVDLHG